MSTRIFHSGPSLPLLVPLPQPLPMPRSTRAARRMGEITQINGSGGQPERPGEAKQSHYETVGRPQASFRAVPVAGVPMAWSAYLEFHIRVAQALGGPFPWLADAGIAPC
jgi:hypothetical protein